MPVTSVKIVNMRGLHARAAAKFAQTAGAYQSDVKVTKDGQTVGGRSIMGLMMLAAAPGSEIEIEVSGSDEAEAFETLVALVEGGFDEELADP